MLLRHCRIAIKTRLFTLTPKLFNKHAFFFSSQNEGKGDKAQPQPTPSQQPQTEYEYSNKEKDLLKTYQVDPVWNMILSMEKNHNFQKELIVHRKEYEKSTYELRSAILFEDLLKTELQIAIYDTKGKPFTWQMLKFIYMLLTVGTSIWGIDLLIQADPRNKVLLEKTFYGKVYKFVIYLLCTTLFLVAWGKHMAFKKRYVEKIIYDTQKQQFTMTKRNFWGIKKYSVVNRFKLLYTQNPFLTSKGTNYFNIDSKEEYMIAFKNAWIKQDLFSHLISQRIKL